VIYLAHGVSLRTSAALLGTLTSLLLAAGLSWAAIKLAHITGLTQASTVLELAHVGDGGSRRSIFLGAMRVGHDHIASTVYTLVLARPLGRRRYRPRAVGAADNGDRGRPRHAGRSEDRTRQLVRSSSVISVAASAVARSTWRNTEVT
jgi:hypothetical protein